MNYHITILLLATFSLLNAQNQPNNCVIYGHVVEMNRLPINNAQVVITSNQSSDTIYSDSTGKYCFKDFLDSGLYNVKIKHSSFGVHTIQGIIIKSSHGGQLDTVELCNIQIQYGNLVNEANNAFDNKEYDKALKLYDYAYKYDSTDKYVIDQFNRIKEMQINPGCGNNIYSRIIEKADELFNNKDFYNARKLYERATILKSSDPYPYEMIEKINLIEIEK